MQAAQRKLAYYELVETYIAGKKKANKSFGASVPLPQILYTSSIWTGKEKKMPPVSGR